MNPTLKFRVLLLEDNNAIRLLFSEIFDDRGYEIFSFSTPAICPLQMIPECRCGVNQTCTDIIVSDLDMPNMTGLSFLMEIARLSGKNMELKQTIKGLKQTIKKLKQTIEELKHLDRQLEQKRERYR